MVEDESRPGEHGHNEDEAVVVEDEAEIQLGKNHAQDGLRPDEDLPMAVRDRDGGEIQVGDAPDPEADPDANRP